MCSENDRIDCPFCTLEMPTTVGTTYGQYHCPTHGTYNLSQHFIEEYEKWLKNDSLLLNRISRYLYETQDSGLRTIEGTFSAAHPVFSALGAKVQPNKRVLLLEHVSQLYPAETELNPLQKYEQTLYNIATRSKKFGQEFALWKKENMSLIWPDRYIVPTFDDEEAESILSALSESGYLNPRNNSDEYLFSLTNAGFEFAENLKRSGATEPIVFIAAYFNAELAQARNTIRDVVKSLGYVPHLVNEEPHNDIIDLRIYDNIRRSQFVVADLTYNRQSVYYEIGFAHGLGLDVILSCRKDSFEEKEDDFKRVHFDLNHRKILVWENEDQLKVLLENHILQSFGRYISKTS